MYTLEDQQKEYDRFVSASDEQISHVIKTFTLNWSSTDKQSARVAAAKQIRAERRKVKAREAASRHYAAKKVSA